MSKDKSLKTMAEAKVEGLQKATYFRARPSLIEFEAGFNLRSPSPELDAYIDQLYAAMKAGAFIPPVDVRVVGERIIARDGHCRTTAAKRLEAEGDPYMLELRQVRGNDADDILHMIGTGSGRPLTPLEMGRGFLRLLNMGMSVADMATRTGMHRSSIENGLALAEAPQAVQNMVAAGQVASHTALKTVRKVGAEKAAETLAAGVQKAKDEGKKKATAKHLAEPKPRGQTLPPAGVVGQAAAEPLIPQVQVEAMQAFIASVTELDARYALPPHAIAKLIAQAQALAPRKGPTFGERCAKFVQGLAERSTLVTFKHTDMVAVIEEAYKITGGK